MSEDARPKARTSPWELSVGPPPESWDDWVELDPASWPEKRQVHYRCIPTVCFNCEAACGLLAFVDKSTGEVAKFEGNPVHPGSRGRTCAKGPATINQVRDPERILKPLKRVGARGAGKWEEVSWDSALDDIAGRIRKAFQEKRHDEVMYHVGRPGDDHFVPRMISAWGIDGLNTHTNVCSASARLGYSMWFGADRPSPDYDGTQFMLLLSAHLETGHYFNPHAQRIMEAREAGARMAVIDARLSNTASHADHWISPWPGSEAALLLAVARELITSGRVDVPYVREWVNWEEYLAERHADRPQTVEAFLEALAEEYAEFTPSHAARECRVPVETVAMLADEIARAGSRFSSHLWRNAAAGNLGGWQVARALVLLHALSGSVGTKGGLNPNAWNKLTPKPSLAPPPINRWNELIFPREWPLSHYEMSFLLPHLLREQGKKLDVYFTRVYNPVWTNPDGASWIDMLEDEDAVGCHVALTPTWSETAQWADYVLPTGLGPERHDLVSQETHAARWVAFRQPVGREFRRLEERGDHGSTLGTNPGEVWEEAELCIDLSRRIDPDGDLGIAKYFESRERPGEAVSLDEYYADIFDNAVPGLPAAAAREGTTTLEYMRRHGAFQVPEDARARHRVDGEGGAPTGFATRSGKLEFHVGGLAEWNFGDCAVPAYVRSHVHWRELDEAGGERLLLPTFRLPTLIHTRSANAKWLQEISHTNPLWVHPSDAKVLGLENGALTRVSTRIGHFVLRSWVTEGIRPGVVACSHHLGRWRLHREVGGQRQASALVQIVREGETRLFRRKEGIKPFKSADPDTRRVWWKEAGVNQNLTFPVQPDPVSGMHCWHQKVTVAPALDGDLYGDVFVDLARSRAVYEEWKSLSRPGPGPDGLRRPTWMNRPMHPTEDAYRVDDVG